MYSQPPLWIFFGGGGHVPNLPLVSTPMRIVYYIPIFLCNEMIQALHCNL